MPPRRAVLVLASSCVLAVFGMFAAQRHREQAQQLLAAQQDLAAQQSKYQELERKLRRCHAHSPPARTSTREPASVWNATGAVPTSEALLATAELVQAEMHAGRLACQAWSSSLASADASQSRCHARCEGRPSCARATSPLVLTPVRIDFRHPTRLPGASCRVQEPPPLMPPRSR